MRIVKDGDNSRLSNSKYFECNECGCVFEARQNEYRIEPQYNYLFYSCKCPRCGNITTTNDFVSTEIKLTVDDIERKTK